MNTNHWDMIFAASAEALNSMLQLHFSSVSFRHCTTITLPDGNSLAEIKCNGLQIVSGGSEQSIALDLTTDGTLNDGELNYQSLVSRVRIALTLLHKSDHASAIHLDYRDGSIEFLDMDVNHVSPQEQALLLGVLKTAYSDMLIRHADKLDYCFATLVSLNNPLIGIKQFDYTWYQPTSGSSGFLAVLCSASDADISAYPRLVDHALLFAADGSQYDSVFLASKQQFLKNALIPSLNNAFLFAPKDSFVSDGEHVTTQKDIPLSPFAVAGTYYTPYIHQFELSVNGDAILLQLNGRCPITKLPHSFVDFALSAKHSVRYDSSLSCFAFVPDPNMTVTTTKTIPSYVKWLEILSLDTLNLIIDSVSKSVSDCIKAGFENHTFNATNVGCAAVAWAIDVLMNEGGISDGMYLRGKRIFRSASDR